MINDTKKKNKIDIVRTQKDTIKLQKDTIKLQNDTINLGDIMCDKRFNI